MASTSSSAEFYDKFKVLKTNVNRYIEVLDLTNASKELSTLKMELREVMGSLPAYDQRSYDLQIRELEDRLKASRPVTKSKFNFTSTSKRATGLPTQSQTQTATTTSTSTKPTGTETVQGSESENETRSDSEQKINQGGAVAMAVPAEASGSSEPKDANPNVGASTSTLTSNSTRSSSSRVIRYESLSNEWISLLPDESGISVSSPESQVYGSSVILENLTRCIIDLRPPPPPTSSPSPTSHTLDTSAKRTQSQSQSQTQSQRTITSIHAKGLRGCILLADVGGSVMFSNVNNSLLILKCHQFRMHDSTNTTVLLYIPSHPIIEHSTNISFGPYPQTTPSFNDRADQADQADPKSRHLEVHDFGWIKEGPSPNWHPLDIELHTRVVQQLDSLTLPHTRHRHQEMKQEEVGGIIDKIMSVLKDDP